MRPRWRGHPLLFSTAKMPCSGALCAASPVPGWHRPCITCPRPPVLSMPQRWAWAGAWHRKRWCNPPCRRAAWSALILNAGWTCPCTGSTLPCAPTPCNTSARRCARPQKRLCSPPRAASCTDFCQNKAQRMGTIAALPRTIVMSLKAQITEDMKTAMRAKDSARLSTIRLLQAAMKQKEVDERIELDDVAIIAIVDKMIKQRKDSIAAFESAGRQDLAAIEQAEMAVLQVYLPQRMSAEEVTAAVTAIVAELGASGPGDMGKVMGAVKAQLAGKADMGQASAAVKAALNP